jgi:hypothetical protein
MIYAKNSMMIVTKPQALIATLLLSVTGHACALTLQNQEFSDAAIFTAVVNHFKKPLMHRFNPDAAGEHKPLLVLGPELKFGKKIMAPSFKHLTRQELVEQQQAVFLLVTNARPDLERNALYVDYDIPSNASFGVLKVFPKDGVLAAEVQDSFRSSSGARSTYGQLYEGVACRDGTEMAYRWNYYASKRGSGRCLGTMFTEFDGWFTPSMEPTPLAQ